MKAAYLGLGSNLGNRRLTLREAVRRLEISGVVSVESISSVYETAPIGRIDQPPFLNLAVKVNTALSAEGLLQHCLNIETNLGRVRRERWGPRTLDIDLLWFENFVCETPALTLPHPRLLERAFVLVPLAELEPALVLNGRRVEEWKRAVGVEGIRNVGVLEDDNAEAATA